MLTELRKKDGSVGPNVLRLGMASQILDLRCSDQRRRPTRPSDRGWRPLSTRLRCLPAEACTPLLSCATRIAQRGVPPSALAAIHALVAIVTPTEGVPRNDEGVPAVVRIVDRGRPGGGGHKAAPSRKSQGLAFLSHPIAAGLGQGRTLGEALLAQRAMAINAGGLTLGLPLK